MRKITVIAALMAALSALLTVQAFSADEILLAKIGDRKISITDFNRLLSYYDAAKQSLLEKNPQLKVNLLKRYAQTIALAGLARKEGFDKLPNIKEQVEMFSNDLIATEFLKKKAADAIKVSEDDIKQYYDGHKDEFKTAEMVRARHILIKVDRSASEDEKKKARDRAEDILKKIKGGEDFSKVASEISDDSESKTKGGDLGFFSKGMMIPEFEKAAFGLKPGEVSDVVGTPLGFNIIKVEERAEASITPLDKVSDKVKEKIFLERRKIFVEDFMDKTIKNAGVELNTEPLTQTKK